ncbi:MAG: hypothetical protein KGP13_11135 [Burkholderiales bacterium]|nr:hypothetical protein [Burkholderiales bacterium]
MDDVLKDLGNIQLPGKPPGKATPNSQASPGAVQGAAAKNTGGLMPSDQWCKQQAGSIAGMKIDTNIISSEFKIPDLEGLQDVFLKALNKGKINKTFPSAKFFQASFETKKVRAIYDTFLAFPEPDTLAALIQISRSSDEQERGDALMALVFLHLQTPEASISPTRWRELHQAALKKEHYTAIEFRARINAYGEFGPKNLRQALGDLVSAGGLQSKYNQSRGIKKEFDTQNYGVIHTATAKDIYFNEPDMPSRQQWEGSAQMGLQIEAAQKSFAEKLPSTRVGKLYAEAAKYNEESISIGNDIIKATQGGNQLEGQLQSIKSLKASSQGEKPVFEDVSPEVQAAQIKMLAKVGTLDDTQKKMLATAQEKRLVAQNIITQSYGELIQLMTANAGGDFVQMTASLPALTAANNNLIQSCIITAKWDQAMRSKDIPKPDAKKVESATTDLNSKYKE